MHLTLPWYVGSSAFNAAKLSPSTIRLSCRLAFGLSPLAILVRRKARQTRAFRLAGSHNPPFR